MTALIVALLAILTLVVVLIIDFRSRREVRRRKLVRTRRVRRQPHLEDTVHAVLSEFRQSFGEIFASFEVWKLERETRVSLRTTPLWVRLSLMTRNQIVRHVWSALEAVTGAVVVVVDNPPQRWSRVEERRATPPPLAGAFSASASVPQFFKDG